MSTTEATIARNHKNQVWGFRVVTSPEVIFGDWEFHGLKYRYPVLLTYEAQRVKTMTVLQV